MVFDLILGVVGSFFGPVGGMIGSAIGTMIDNKVFPNKTEGPRLDDLDIQVSTYGKPIPHIYGPQCPMAGNVIRSTGLIETATTTESTFMSAEQPTVYTYRITAAILLADRVGRPPIRGIRKIWANANVIFDAEVLNHSGLITGFTSPQGYANGVPLELGQLKYLTHTVFDTLTVYPGDFAQMPDPTLAAFFGADEVTAYRGSAYIVIKDLKLEDFGNRLPNLRILVVADDEISTGAIATDICRLCGIDPNTISSSRIDDSVPGYMIGVASSGTGALQPLALAFDFDCCDVGGGVRFTPRSLAPVYTVPSADLGAHADGDSAPADPLSWSRSPETGLPQEASITFIDPERDYQPNTATERRVAGSADSNLSNQLAVVVGADLAQKIATRMLWEPWLSRQAANGQVDDKWAALEAGKKYIFETPAGLEPLRLVRRTRGANAVIELELRRDRTEVYRASRTGVEAPVPYNPLILPGETELILLDIPILIDADNNPGFYFVVVGTSDGWRGADVSRALTLTGTYNGVASVGRSSTVGDVAGIVPVGTIPDTMTGLDFDDVTTVRVVLRDEGMTLASVDDDELAAGANLAFVGSLADTPSGEIVQFGVATPVVPGTYDLTHLIRGCRGTEFAVDEHVADETFVLLSGAKRANFGAIDLDLERVYKGVSVMGDPDVDAIYFTNTGAGLRPFSPVDLEVSGDTGDDLVLTWIRRSRLQSGELGEAGEVYRVRIMNAAGTAVVREEIVTEPTFEYSLAMQTTDFGGPASDLTWRVAQVSAIFGAGVYATWVDPVPVTG